MKHTELLMIAVAVFAATAAQAQPRFFVSGTQAGSTVTNNNQYHHIVLGRENSRRNRAAINVTDTHLQIAKNRANNRFIAFSEIDFFRTMPITRRIANGIISKDKNDVTVAHMYRMNSPAWNTLFNTRIMPDYSHLGRMSFAKVGNLDVYFGDWADVKAGAGVGTAGTNTSVFYNGTGKTTRMPTSGKATYAVKGINNYVNQNSPIMTGTLTADFGAKRLNGTIAKKGLSVAINNAVIHTAQASFYGAAKANGSINGRTRGNFYGNNAAALAGVADFNNPKLNTAFGGTRR